MTVLSFDKVRLCLLRHTLPSTFKSRYQDCECKLHIYIDLVRPVLTLYVQFKFLPQYEEKPHKEGSNTLLVSQSILQPLTRGNLLISFQLSAFSFYVIAKFSAVTWIKGRD